MAKLNFLNNYKVLYIYHPDEPIEGSEIRKNASIKSLLDKIRGKR